MSAKGEARTSWPSLVACWAVHGLTASGAAIAYAAFTRIEQAQWRQALLLLLLALAVDGIDGPLARWVQIKRRLPRIDGGLLDLLVDYLTFVFVPTIFICKDNLVPQGLSLPLAGLIQISSLYHYARQDLKSADNYFRGFPALWNVVAFYLYMMRAGPGFGVVVICTFSVLTFAPVLFVHPVRVREFRPWLPLLAAVWALSSAALLLFDLRDKTSLCLAISLAAAIGLATLGVVRTLRGAKPFPTSEAAA